MFRQLKTYQIVVDVVVGVLFFLFTAPVATDTSIPFAGELTALVALFMAGALAVRRLSPMLALGIAWAGAIVQMAVGLAPVPGNIAIFGVLYVTAAYGTRLVFWLGLASAVTGAAVITVYLVLLQYFGATLTSPSQTAIVAVAVFVSAGFALLLSWTVGALVRAVLRARANRLAQQRAEAAAATEQERGRIARDMHDIVAHSLAVVIAQADGARYAAAADPDAATTALGTISQTSRAALADVRLLLTQLRHQQGEGPQPTIADLEELYAQVRSSGVDLRVEVDPVPPGEPPASVQLAVYRILQEALTNALRHGDGGAVDVRLSWLPGRVELWVRNGIGQNPAGGNADGHGIVGMRERAQLAGGTLHALAESGVFVITANIPVGASQEGA